MAEAQRYLLVEVDIQGIESEHGPYDVLSAMTTLGKNETLFGVADLETMTVDGTQPIFAAMTCSASRATPCPRDRLALVTPSASLHPAARPRHPLPSRKT